MPGPRRRGSPGRGRILARFGLVLATGIAACLPKTPRSDFEGGLIRMGSGDAPREVELLFLGVAGWQIRTAESSLLTAPLWSRPGLFEVGLGKKLVPDTAAIVRAIADLGVAPLEETAAILVGHGHYDHLLDVPWIAARLAPEARILANETTRLQVAAFEETLGLDPSRTEDVTGAAAGPVAPGRWIRISDDVRILPIVGDHGPHFAGHTLYSGRRVKPLPRPPGPATDWLDGVSLAFLIDVLAPDGTVAFRVYYQDAIPREPGGIVPEEILEEAPVDVALLVPASFAEVQWHPEALMQNLRPRMVILQHWEDFFSPADEPAEQLAFTILPDFMARANRMSPCAACVRLPLPGARYVFPLGSPTPNPVQEPRDRRGGQR